MPPDQLLSLEFQDDVPGSSSASTGGVLGSSPLIERSGTGSVLWARAYLPKFSHSPCRDTLNYFGLFLVLLLQNTLCRID